MATVSNWPGYNTYVGARYVPLMVGEWDISKQYEPLMVVTHEGASYTSNTFVPVGIDITNETYWTLSGDYNSAIASIQLEVNALKNSVSLNTSAITNLNTYNYLYGKSIVIYGDSLSDSINNPGLQPNWVTAFIAKYGDICTVTNRALTGDRYIDSSANPNYGISSKIDSAKDLDSFDIAIIFAGYNDFSNNPQADFGIYYSSDRATLNGALRIAFSKLNSVAGLTTYVILPTPTAVGMGSYYKPLEWYREVIYNNAIFYGLHIIDGNNAPRIRTHSAASDIFYDSIHLSTQYAPEFADFIVQKMISGGDSTRSVVETYINTTSYSGFNDMFNTSLFTPSGSCYITMTKTGDLRLHIEGKLLANGVFMTLLPDITPFESFDFPIAINSDNATRGLSYINCDGGRISVYYFSGNAPSLPGTISFDIDYFAPAFKAWNQYNNR